MDFGYRGFKIKWDQQSNLFLPCSIFRAVVWVGRPPFLEARCLSGDYPHDEREAPHEQCKCGIYCMKALEGALLTKNVPLGSIYAVIHWSGRFIEGPDGYRVERARLGAILPSPCNYCGQQASLVGLVWGATQEAPPICQACIDERAWRGYFDVRFEPLESIAMSWGVPILYDQWSRVDAGMPHPWPADYYDDYP